LSARSPRQRRGSLRKNPYISALNQRAGGNQNPTLETLQKVAKALGVKVDDLIN